MHAESVNRHLAGAPWLLGDDEPTFADATLRAAVALSKRPMNAMPLNGRFEQFDCRWKGVAVPPGFW